MVVLLLAPFERLERDDDLAAGAGALTLPRLGGTVERVALDRQLDTPSRHVLEQLELGASPILGGEQEVRVAHDRQLLAAHVRGAERRLRPGRLPDVHDARVWSGVGERVRERLTPHGVDADGEAVVLELLRDATELAASHGEDKVGSEHDESQSGQEEIYLCLAGSGTLEIDGETVEMKPGRYILVSPESKRRSTWICCYSTKPARLPSGIAWQSDFILRQACRLMTLQRLRN